MSKIKESIVNKIDDFFKPRRNRLALAFLIIAIIFSVGSGYVLTVVTNTLACYIIAMFVYEQTLVDKAIGVKDREE